MFKPKTSTIIREELDKAIEVALAELSGYKVVDEEYATICEQLEMLYKLRSQKREPAVSMETLVTVGANLAGILLILNHERMNVVASKALGFVMKSKM